jgi:X-X-X-Leu-X-X-Gly heptad repeat protein
VSRFEVTRAQYAAFDSKYEFPAGTGNYPASGITFEQAQAYAAWLAERTGEPWRLPTAAEAKTLYGRGKGEAHSESTGGENTLDLWAGYSPNPEDAARLQEKAAALGGESPLLKEVGWFRSRGTQVFDLGGNVAEWTVGEDGAGTLAGGSADLPSGVASAKEVAGEPYRGFRVVATP